jgi:Flp pilus assembly pilin Flp
MNNTAATHTSSRTLDETGQTMAEYGVVLALITLGVVAALTLLDAAIGGMFVRVAGYLGG